MRMWREGGREVVGWCVFVLSVSQSVAATALAALGLLLVCLFAADLESAVVQCFQFHIMLAAPLEVFVRLLGCTLHLGVCDRDLLLGYGWLVVVLVIAACCISDAVSNASCHHHASFKTQP